MKITKLDIVSLENYLDISNKLIPYINKTYYGKGVNSIILSRFISYLRTELNAYVKLKHNNINIKILLPHRETGLIEKSIVNKKEYLTLRLNYQKICQILNGDELCDDYIHEVLDQFDKGLLKEKPKNFTNYLIGNIDNLASLCASELKSDYSINVILKNIVKQSGWIKISHKSLIFNDYYNFFQEDLEKNKKIFMYFIKKVIEGLKE